MFCGNLSYTSSVTPHYSILKFSGWQDQEISEKLQMGSYSNIILKDSLRLKKKSHEEIVI